MLRPELLPWLLQQVGVPRCKLALLPDFLVISPPKTGSTWLADNVRRHPGLFVPARKEVKYFSSFGDWLGLEWYLDHFAEAGDRLKGEASPSYALLPLDRIRLVRELMPQVKLVFLMRDPVDRAWSHVRHTFRYGEAAFAYRAIPLEEATDQDWRDGARHPWIVANNDYLGQLQRWLSIFPREQFFVGFYEDLARRPESLLRDLFAFLGVDGSLDLAGFPVRDKILEGMEVPLTTGLERELRQAQHARTIGLVEFLRDQLGLDPPAEWEWWREPLQGEPPAPVPENAFALEASFSSARCVIGEHHGYELVCDRGRFLAMLPGLAPGRPELMPEQEWRSHQAEGRCFAGSSLPDVLRQIDQHFLGRQEATRSELERTRSELQQERERVTRLEQRLRDLEALVERRCPLTERLGRWLRRMTAHS